MTAVNPDKMIYRNFGNSGLKVSAIALGTATYKGMEDLEINQKTIETALKLGINHFDTS
jgi:aryl-alcohol dehydrogenase-like predicted oxidoreductase